MNAYLRYERAIAMPLAGAVTLLAITGHTQAVPYASGVNQVGNTVSFILNEPADTVTITRNSGNTITLNAAASGQHSFDMTGFSDYTISVTHSAPASWAESAISAGNPMFTFERANGIAVNQNPASEYFGRFYISQRDAKTALYGGAPRTMGDGIYVFNPDGTDAFGITDPSDTTAARTAGLDFTSSPASPFRISVGPDDTLYIGDASDPTGGIYYTDPDVSTGGNLLAGLGGAQPITGQNHGSILSTPVVTGSLASGDLVLYTIDQDLSASVPDTGSHVWRYDIGGTTNFAGPPTLLLDASTLGNNSDGTPILLDSNGGNFDSNYDNGTLPDIIRDPITGNFIVLRQSMGLLILDPTFSNILFNSRQFSLDHGMDADVFRHIISAQISADGRNMAFRLANSSGAWVLPMDQDGLPILDLSSEAYLGAEFFQVEPTFALAHRGPIAYDLAGNLYTSGNLFERAGIYSPGGDTTAITRSNGTFTINGTTYGDHLIGDLNGDGFVGIDDLSIVLGNWNDTVAHGVFMLGDPTGDGFVGIYDLNLVLSNWNNGTPPSAAPEANIPEPNTGLLALASAISLVFRRKRHKMAC